MSPLTDHQISTPVGPMQVPGFPAAEAMSDEEVVAAMNAAAFIDPVLFTVAKRRRSLVTDYCHAEKRYRWWKRADYEARSKESRPPSFTDIINFLAGK